MRIIKMPHKTCPNTCSTNGIDDLYEWKTGTRPPDYLLYFLGGVCSFVYIKDIFLAKHLRMVFWSLAGNLMFELLGKVLDSKIKIIDNNSFSTTLTVAKNYIDKGYPLIAGAVDMCYLSYKPEFYNKIHLPSHYITIVGYDDEKQVVLVYDCEEENYQEISYTDLEKAWNVSFPNVTGKNCFYVIEFTKQIPTIKEIIEKGLKIKSESMLYPKNKMFGIPAIKEFANDFIDWTNELEKVNRKTLDDKLTQLVLHTGSIIPILPKRIFNSLIDEAYLVHQGTRDRFSSLLSNLNNNYKEWDFYNPSLLFKESGILIEKFTEVISSYIMREKNNLSEIPSLLYQIAEKEENAYKLILKEITK